MPLTHFNNIISHLTIRDFFPFVQKANNSRQKIIFKYHPSQLPGSYISWESYSKPSINQIRRAKELRFPWGVRKVFYTWKIKYAYLIRNFNCSWNQLFSIWMLFFMVVQMEEYTLVSVLKFVSLKINISFGLIKHARISFHSTWIFLAQTSYTDKNWWLKNVQIFMSL